jgi:hypothetical protein
MQRIKYFCPLAIGFVLSGLSISAQFVEGADDNVTLSITTDTDEIFMGDSIGIRAKVDNFNTPNPINVTRANLVLPDGWGSEAILASAPSGTLIPANSSGLFLFDVEIPMNISSGNHRLFVTVETNDINENTNSTLIGQTEVAVQLHRSINVANINWDHVTLLIIIYTIPGVAIEQGVQALRGLVSKEWSKDEAEVRSRDLVLKKMDETVPVEPKQQDEFRLRYEGHYRNRVHEDSENKARVIGLALLLSSFPSVVLVWYGLGLLQILGAVPSPIVYALDIFIAMLSMTFVSKPTHQIIQLLEKLRTYKTGTKVSE